MFGQVLNIVGEELKYSFATSWHRFRSSDQPLKKILINGSPKTGTTWMLKMMISVPGYRGARGYNFRGDIDHYREVLPGEVVHGHDSYTTQLWDILSSNEIKVILMIRDPRDQAVSRMFHIRRDSSLRWHQTMRDLSDDEALLASIEGRPGLRGVVSEFELTQSWLAQSDKALCVKYEDLISNPVSGFQRALQYLGVEVNHVLIQAIVERNRFERLSVGRRFWQSARRPGQEDTSSHFRKGIVGDWRNYFKEAHTQRLKELAGQTLIELGYEKDFNW